MWYAIGGIAAIIVLFIAWRWTSVGRGVRQRGARILELMDSIGQKLEAGEVVEPEEVLELARKPQTRFMLYAGLREMNQSSLIPADFDSSDSQAESALAYWLMHPNELQDVPERMEHIEEVTVNGEEIGGGHHIPMGFEKGTPGCPFTALGRGFNAMTLQDVCHRARRHGVAEIG